MEPWVWAVILKPLGLLILFTPGVIVLWLLKKKLPDGRLKRFLLFKWKV